MSEWPKHDPVTKRMICKSCWNHVHRRHNIFNQIIDACDGECDCVHRSEENWAAIERQKATQNRRELRQRLKAQLEDPSNPLLAINHDHKPKAKGKAHA